MRDFDNSLLRSISKERNVPIVEFLLNTFYNQLGDPITILGVSPISKHIVKGALLAAKECDAPMMFIASLNQIDYDGGYTGWTPKSFTKFLENEVKRLGIVSPIILALDHGGPWLKDLHIQRGYSFEEALESTYKSIESAIIAGYDVIHIDTTVDPYTISLSTEIVARRTLDLLEFAEDVRKSHDISLIDYEIGSDRWKYKDEKHSSELVSLILKGLRKRKLDKVRVIFMVGDVGTKVIPGNLLNVEKAKKLVNVASKYGLYLKTHSTDYVTNPEVFPMIGIGGANIGPMFADIEYKVVKELAIREKNLYEKGEIRKYSEILENLYKSILEDGRWRKYSKVDLDKLDEDKRELILGLCSRYVWFRINSKLDEMIRNLSDAGMDAESIIVEELKNIIIKYLKSFNLCLINKRFKKMF
ncbi:MAG: class II D-tagatose-bisphosphate aldolase, non-catalytic subunit [Thermoproteales archaeon]|nr:class II D-tagatose-bisphosphate aldolase, non-catalytic subunit [Thermoproteales archaeon]